MENNTDSTSEKKYMNKAKSCFNGPPMKLKVEPTKRKSFNVNEAVKSLDIALGRLKKSKLSDYNSNCYNDPARRGLTRAAMFMENVMEPTSTFIDNASMMSMNISHYELMRNLSNCNSVGACSGTTCNTFLNPTDTRVKDENLEKYFRSAEMWNRNGRDNGSNALRFKHDK